MKILLKMSLTDVTNTNLLLLDVSHHAPQSVYSCKINNFQFLKVKHQKKYSTRLNKI